jgi:predicted dehydrogenase
VVVGLGTISELVLPTYVDHPDIDAVALCDRDRDRVARWQPVWPAAASTAHVVEYLRGETASLVLDGATARRVLRALVTVLDSSDAGRPLDVDYS